MIVLQELTEEYKKDLTKGNFIVTNAKVKKKDNSLMLEIMNTRENKYINIKVHNFELLYKNENVDLIGSIVTKLYCNGCFTTFGKTTLIGCYISLKKDEQDIDIVAK